MMDTTTLKASVVTAGRNVGWNKRSSINANAGRKEKKKNTNNTHKRNAWSTSHPPPIPPNEIEEGGGKTLKDGCLKIRRHYTPLDGPGLTENSYRLPGPSTRFHSTSGRFSGIISCLSVHPASLHSSATTSSHDPSSSTSNSTWLTGYIH